MDVAIDGAGPLPGARKAAGATLNRKGEVEAAKERCGGNDAWHLPTTIGPVAIAYSKDPVAPAKVVTDYAKTNDKFSVVGAVLGNTVLDEKGVGALATLPSLDQMRATLIGLIQAPATKIAGVLQAPAGQLARVFNAYATKDAA